MASLRQININRGVSPPTVTFNPTLLEVKVGDQIFWTNNDSQPHWPGLKKQDGSIDNSFFMPNQIAEASDMGSSSSSIFSSDVAKTLVYVCSLHCEPGRSCSEAGVIVVT
jgi:plastocyanin